MSKIKLKSALNMTSIFSLLIPILVISLVAVKFTNDYILQMAQERNEQVSQNVANQLEEFLKGPEEQLVSSRDTLNYLQKDHPLTTREMMRIISVINEKRFSFDHFVLIDDDDKVVDAYPVTNEQIGISYTQNEVVKALRKEPDQIKWSSTYISSFHGINSIDLGIKVGDYLLLGTIHVRKIQGIVSRLVLRKNTYATIVDSTGVYVAHSNPIYVAERVTDPLVNIATANQGDFVYFGEPMSYTILPLLDYGWKVIVYEPYSVLFEARYRFVRILAIIMMVSFIGVIAVAARNNSRIERHFLNIVKNLKQVALGNYTTIATSDIYKEFDDIIVEFNKMISEIKNREEEIVAHREEMISMNEELEQRIDDRTNKLIKANLVLEKTLEDLKATQQQLVESEKMASLGSLVAGIAHEINTPIGVTMTAITYLMEESRNLERKYKADSLMREDVQEYLDVFSEGARIIEKNIQKASELIKSFKMMAVDQSNMDVREFELGAYIKDVLFSLDPKIKKVKAQLVVDVKEDIIIYANPGDVSQIMTNLVMNALIHGLQTNKEGKITIALKVEKGTIFIDVTDNGVGIPEENIHLIFEPFFTTRRGHGGTGLGLNIVYNLVTHKLKGTIRCISEEGVGTTFQIRMPLLKEPQSVQNEVI